MSVTSIVHCKQYCNFLISWCYQQTPRGYVGYLAILGLWLTWSLFRDA